MFLLCFDPLGDDEDSVLVRELDNVAQKAFVLLVLVDSTNVFHIDLNEIRREIDDSGKVRVMASEVVYGNLATDRFQAFRRNGCHFSFFRIDAFEYFENHPGRIDSEFNEGIAYGIDESRIRQVVGSEIDSKNDVLVREFGKGFFRHYAGNGAQTSVLLRCGEE